jgi:hypothetical protein
MGDRGLSKILEAQQRFVRGTGGTLTVSDGVHSANILILGQYSGAGFTASIDNGGGTLVTYHDPHSLV